MEHLLNLDSNRQTQGAQLLDTKTSDHCDNVPLRLCILHSAALKIEPVWDCIAGRSIFFLTPLISDVLQQHSAHKEDNNSQIQSIFYSYYFCRLVAPMPQSFLFAA